jgi:hypothetical protein
MRPVMSIDADGDKWWWLGDNLHRADGPAIEWHDGDLQWWLYGTPLSFDDWLKQTNGLTDEEKVMYKLEHG